MHLRHGGSARSRGRRRVEPSPIPASKTTPLPPPPKQATAQRSTRPDQTGPSSNSSLIPTFRAGNDASISDLLLQSAWRRFDGTAQKEDLGSVTSNLKFIASGTACNRVPASGPGKAAARSNFLAACCPVAWAPWDRELASSPFASSPIHLGRVGSELVLFLECASIPRAPPQQGALSGQHRYTAPLVWETDAPSDVREARNAMGEPRV